jgi:hypothetical protein
MIWAGINDCIPVMYKQESMAQAQMMMMITQLTCAFLMEGVTDSFGVQAGA